MDTLIETIKYLDFSDLKIYSLINRLHKDTCEIYFRCKLPNGFNVPELTWKQTYFIYSKMKSMQQIDNMDCNTIGLTKKAFFPPVLCKMINLENIWITGGRVRTIPATITQLINLKVLNLSCNYISKISPEITQLTSLTHLNLSHNELFSVPDFTPLTNMTDLDVSCNHIEEFDSYLALLEMPRIKINVMGNDKFQKK